MAISAAESFLSKTQRFTKLEELRALVNEKVEVSKPRSFFQFLLALFIKNPQEAERQKKLAGSVRDMASFLALSPEVGPTVDTIIEKGKILAQNKALASEEDKALLERTRLAALLRKEPGRLDEIKKNTSIYFKTKENRELFAKWKKAGFPEDAYLFNPTLSSLIFKLHLHRKMHSFCDPLKGFSDSFQYDSKSHKFKIRVNGKFRNLAKIGESFSLKDTPLLGGFVTSLVSKKDDKERWDYLPHQGLTTWNESGWKKLSPIAQLTKKQVAFAQQSALRTDGTKGGVKDYVVEIVITREDYRQLPLISGFQESFSRFAHPWIRIITPDGKLFSAGFNMGQDISKIQPAAAIRGSFRSPDTRETRPFSQRYISGFAVSERTARAVIKEMETYQKEGTRFNFVEKNCTAFVQRVKEIVDPKKKASFSVELPELFWRCLPVGLQKLGTKLSFVGRSISFISKQLAPPIVTKVARMASTLFRLITERLLLAFAGRWFSYGKKDSFPTEEDPHQGIPWYKVVTHINIALKRKLVRVFMPRKLGEWMETLPQNRIAKDDVPLLQQYDSSAYQRAS